MKPVLAFVSALSLVAWGAATPPPGGGAIRHEPGNPAGCPETPAGRVRAPPWVAVSAGFVPFALGTETDGSLTCPTSVNGVVDIKPTLGLVSRAGIVPTVRLPPRDPRLESSLPGLPGVAAVARVTLAGGAVDVPSSNSASSRKGFRRRR